MTADYISEIGEIDESLEDLLADIQKAYNRQRERYEAIFAQSGYFPPELIAAIHYRESASDYLAGEFSIYIMVIRLEKKV